jgi:GAF domain-containing protein
MAESRRDRPKTKAELERALKRETAARKRATAERDGLQRRLDSGLHALTEALDQQTATSEVLKVISQSPTDVRPVFQAVIENAVRLSGGVFGRVFRRDGQSVSLAAHQNFPDEAGDFPRPLDDETLGGRAARTGQMIRVADVEVDPSMPATGLAAFRARRVRSVLVVPISRQGETLGSIVVGHADVGAFSDAHVAMLQTFADQAAIAIENVRLFTELDTRNRDLTAALDQQTATADILRVISGSPNDLQPVMEAVVQSAARLCGASEAQILRPDGDVLRLVAETGLSAIPPARPISRGYVAGRAFVEQRTLHVPDILEVLSDYPETSALAFGTRTHLATPLMREGVAIGVIRISRREVRPFTDQQIELLKTFADQAVIAIENVRLFTELEEKNRALSEAHARVTESLDRQTASAEILRVISQSQTDVQPVFEAILRNALRLCGGVYGSVYRVEAGMIHLVANEGRYTADELAYWRSLFPRPVTGPGTMASAIRTKTVRRVSDVETDPDVPPEMLISHRARGVRSAIQVPMLRRDEIIGALSMTHREPDAFSDTHVALLRTFADQAVIAIENARLLTELQQRTRELSRSVDQLTALGEVSRAVSSTLDLETVLTTIVSRAVELSGLDGGVVFEYDELTEEFVHRAATEQGGQLALARRATRVRKGEGLLGRTAVTLSPEQVPDILIPGTYESRLRDNLIQSGVRALLAVPMISEGKVIGAVVVSRNQPGPFPAETIDLLRTFATQSALAIRNARLFEEIAQKSRELEAASRHKSEFLANMSHELRTPLNAIIGFSDVLLEGMFGEVNEKQTEYLRDILSSGTHLLSLINDILDLSKIEAGRMELDLTDFDVPSAIDNALTLMRERASRHGITLTHVVDRGLGHIRADERKFKQVLLNLLSNAVKFTPSGGKVEVRGRLAQGMVEVAVTDTGEGIALEDQQAVFEEFRQVGKSSKKIEGTGLGLALCRKFVELHGGSLGVESQVGVGSTFTFTIPDKR